MSKVLITGANGFVGNHLVREFAAHGWQVVGVGGQTGSQQPENLDAYYVVDLNDPTSVQQIDFNTIDGVVHLAGLAAVGPSFSDPLQYITANIGMEINLCEVAQTQGATPKLIIVSTGALYDPKASLPLKENSTVIPNSPYAVSKIGQEQMGLYYQSRGFEVVIARPFNHIGPGQNLGFIVPDLAKQVVDVERGAAAEVLVGNLDAKRDYTDVRDIARAYRLLLEKGVSGETYNICSGKALSGHEILDTIVGMSDAKITIRQDPKRMRPSDTPEIYGSHAKLSTDTGWQPEISIGTTLTDAIADWRSR